MISFLLSFPSPVHSFDPRHSFPCRFLVVFSLALSFCVHYDQPALRYSPRYPMFFFRLRLDVHVTPRLILRLHQLLSPHSL